MILDKVIDYANKMYPLQSLIRYNNSQHINDESVIEHVGFVAKIVMELHNYYEFDLLRALKMALVHDDTEIYITDIPHNVKKRYPQLRDTIKKCEDIASSTEFGPSHFDLTTDFEDQLTVESKIVKIADNVSCIQYARNEMDFGHQGYMKEVYTKSYDRSEEVLKELEEFKR